MEISGRRNFGAGLALAGLLALGITSAQGQITWDGDGAADTWDDDLNFSADAAPTADDAVLLSSVPAEIIFLGQTNFAAYEMLSLDVMEDVTFDLRYARGGRCLSRIPSGRCCISWGT